MADETTPAERIREGRYVELPALPFGLHRPYIAIHNWLVFRFRWLLGLPRYPKEPFRG